MNDGRRVGLIDLGAGNAFNVAVALERMGIAARHVHSASDWEQFETVVFPGVANFGFVIEQLHDRELFEPLRASIVVGVPYLGICVGLQVLFEASEEAPGVAGLGIFRGSVARVRGAKVPHMGWNRVVAVPSLRRVDDGWAYFANSYAPVAEAEETVAITEYEAPFASMCARERILGVQFHPERSGAYGTSVLQQFFSAQPAVYAR